MLMSIPVISPIEITMLPQTQKLLPSPDASGIDEADYTVDETTVEPAKPRSPYVLATPALSALSEIERAAEISEHHDFGWWAERVATIRAAIKAGTQT